MDIFLTARDVVQFAIRIEEDGEMFYHKAALTAEVEAVRKLFSGLEDEEVQHKRVFESMLSTLDEYDPPESYRGEYLAYLRDYIDDRVVFAKDVKGRQLPRVRDALSAIDFAMQRELDSVLFYQELKQLLPEKDSNTVGSIVEEERRHFARLAEAKKNYL